MFANNFNRKSMVRDLVTIWGYTLDLYRIEFLASIYASYAILQGKT